MLPTALVDSSIAVTSIKPPNRVLSVDALSFVTVTSENISVLKSLNAEIFPVPYPDAYYTTTTRPELAKFCKLIYLDGIPIGQVTCTLKRSEREGEARVYKMLMGVLSPYRSRGIGTYASQQIAEGIVAHNRRVKRLRVAGSEASSMPTGDSLTQLSNLPITSVFMHVHVLNTDARRFYERHGFTERRRIENFYRRKGSDDTTIKDAWLFERDIDKDGETECIIV